MVERERKKRKTLAVRHERNLTGHRYRGKGCGDTQGQAPCHCPSCDKARQEATEEAVLAIQSLWGPCWAPVHRDYPDRHLPVSKAPAMGMPPCRHHFCTADLRGHVRQLEHTKPDRETAF